MNLSLKILSFFRLTRVLKKKITFFFNQINFDAKTWIHFIQENFKKNLKFVKISTDLCKNMTKNSTLFNLNFFINNHLVLGFILKKKNINLDDFVKTISRNIYVTLIKINNKIYSTMQIKTFGFFNYYNKINKINSLMDFYLKMGVHAFFLIRNNVI